MDGNIIPHILNQDLTLDALAAEPIWVAWITDGDGRKRPLDPNTAGAGAKADDPATWGSRKAAQRLAQRRKGGLGVELSALSSLPGWRLCGVDLDGCIDALGNAAPWASAVVDRFGSYAELSPSGTGLHVLFLARESDFAALQKAGKLSPKGGKEFSLGGHTEIALYLGGRFFTVTGSCFDPSDILGAAPIRPVSKADLEWLINDQGPAFMAGQGRPEDSPSGGDGSGSGVAFKAALDLARYGMSEAEARDALAEDDGEAGEWWNRVDDRQQCRVITNAFSRIEGERARLADSFDEPPQSDEIDALLDGGEAGVKPSELGRYSLDHDGVIRAFTDRHSGELRFDHHAGRWFRFNGNYWRREETKLATHYARELSAALARRDPKGKALLGVPAWEAVERGARTVREFACTADIWNRDPMLLGTPRGTVDLRTGALRPGDPRDHISRVTAVAPIPLDRFRAERDCPQWLAFLDHALAGDAAAIRFLQAWGGYSLTGDTREQVLLFVYGPGGSGKGTAINTIGDVLGDYAINVGMETLSASKSDRHTTELARLHGARMARASETEKGRAWAENRIKTLTGQDTITARFMRQDDFEFLPEFKLTIFGNNRPSLRDVDAAIRRRFMVLPFDHPPAHKDARLPEKLRGEWRGILSWLVQGCLDWQANGLTRPAVVDAATDAYFAEQDTFGQWLGECCELDPRASATVADLWDSWSRYAYRLGEEPGSKNKTFPETLAQRGFKSGEKIGAKRGKGFHGLRVVDDQADGFDTEND